MSVSNIAKSQSLVRALIDQLSKRLPTYTLTENLTSSGDQLMVSQSSTPTAGQNNAAIMIGLQDTQFTDVIGIQQATYSPMAAQVVQEATVTPALATSTSLVSLAFQIAISIELEKLGIRQAWYLNPLGTVPALSQFSSFPTAPTGSTTVVVTSPDAYWPLSGQ